MIFGVKIFTPVLFIKGTVNVISSIVRKQSLQISFLISKAKNKLDINISVLRGLRVNYNKNLRTTNKLNNQNCFYAYSENIELFCRASLLSGAITVFCRVGSTFIKCQNELFFMKNSNTDILFVLIHSSFCLLIHPFLLS